jgi:hypothetical protein
VELGYFGLFQPSQNGVVSLIRVGKMRGACCR